MSNKPAQESALPGYVRQGTFIYLILLAYLPWSWGTVHFGSSYRASPGRAPDWSQVDNHECVHPTT